MPVAMKTELIVRIRVPKGTAVRLGAALLLGSLTLELNSDSAVITSYFLEPARQVSFSRIVTTGDTHLARKGASMPFGHVIHAPKAGGVVSVGGNPDPNFKLSVYGDLRINGKLCFDDVCNATFQATVGNFRTNPIVQDVACGSPSLELAWQINGGFSENGIPQTFVQFSQKRQGQSSNDWLCKVPPTAFGAAGRTCPGKWYVVVNTSIKEDKGPFAGQWQTLESSQNWQCIEGALPGPQPNVTYNNMSSYCNIVDPLASPPKRLVDAYGGNWNSLSVALNRSVEKQINGEWYHTVSLPIPACSGFNTQDYTWNLSVGNPR